MFLALVILNFSIDAPDAYSDTVAEDLSFNDIESITEFVLEDVIGIYNAIPEHDENDYEDEGGGCKKYDFSFNQKVIYVCASIYLIIKYKPYFDQKESNPQSPFLKGLIKPPQA